MNGPIFERELWSCARPVRPMTEWCTAYCGVEEVHVIDHISVPVADLGRSATFYDAVLATLRLWRRKERPGAIGYGPMARPAPVFWILDRARDGAANAGIGLHISFTAPDRSSVDDFYSTALRHGGIDAGAPGMRPQYTMPFYGAFIIDPDGFKIEAVCRTPDE